MDYNLLAFDMGVWGPFGARRERVFQLSAHVQNANGEWITKEVPGANSLQEWVEGWNFATTGFVMGAYIERGVADAYRQMFVEMAGNYPTSWWICCRAEWEFRHEFAVTELRKQRQFHAAHPDMSAYDPNRPWNSVLLAAVTGITAIQYWEAALKEKARRWMESGRSKTHPSWVNKHEAHLPPPPPTPGPKQDRKRKRATPPPQKQWQSDTGGKGGKPNDRDPNAKRNDGRYFWTVDFVHLCFAYNRNENGCGRVCTAQPPRAHVCEWCRGAHRAIQCPVHPGWKPPAKGKSKGTHK